VWYAWMYSLALCENLRTLSTVNTCCDLQVLTVFQKYSFFLFSLIGCCQ
jgi:hypothetical protein